MESRSQFDQLKTFNPSAHANPNMEEYPFAPSTLPSTLPDQIIDPALVIDPTLVTSPPLFNPSDLNTIQVPDLSLSVTEEEEEEDYEMEDDLSININIKEEEEDLNLYEDYTPSSVNKTVKKRGVAALEIPKEFQSGVINVELPVPGSSNGTNKLPHIVFPVPDYIDRPSPVSFFTFPIVWSRQ